MRELKKRLAKILIERSYRATGVPLCGFLYSAIDGRFPLQGRRKMPQSVM